MAIGHVTYWLKELLAGRPTWRHLGQLRTSQWLPRDHHRATQFAMLRQQVTHAAYRVSHYKQRFSSVGLDPSGVTSWADVSSIPVLSKAELRAAGNLLVASHHRDRLAVVTTSGSTGEPMRLLKARSSGAWDLASMVRAWEWWGARPGDPTMYLWGVAAGYTRRQEMAARLKQVRYRLTGIRRFSAFDTSEESLLARVRLLADGKIQVVYGYGGAIQLLADCAGRNGIALDQRGLKAVFYTSETLYAHDRSQISAALGCPTVSEYGSVETGIIAYECPEGYLHVNDEFLYVEVVDADDKPVYEEEGQVVVTQLRNTAAPLIRYRLGDLAVAADPGFVCPCGRGLSVLRELRGRQNAVLVSGRGTRVHPEAFDYAFRPVEAVRRYRVVEESPGSLRILLEAPGGHSSEDELTACAGLGAYLPEGFTYSLEWVRELPNEPSGKFRWVVPLSAEGAPSSAAEDNRRTALHEGG